MKRARRTAVVTGAALLAVAACGGGEPSAPTPAGVPAEAIACTTLSDDCYLPFPTNLFTEAAPGATGLRLAIRAENFPTPVTADVLRTYPPELLNANDGFSVAAPVVLPLPELPDPASLPASPAASVEPSASVRIWDLDAGEPVAFRAVLDGRAANETPARGLVSLFPAGPFPNGHTLVALVTDRVRTASGAPMPRFEGFARLVDPTADGGDGDAGRVRAAYRPVLAEIEGAMHEDPARVVTATSFTVRSNEPTTRRMRALADAILRRAESAPPRFEIDQVVPPLPALETQGVAAGVIGRMTAPDYRGPDGMIVWDERGRPVEQREHTLELVLKLPRASAGRAPVVIFGHGLGAFKETLFQVSSELGQRGYATIGIDIGGHGSRMGEDGPIYGYFTFDALLATRDLFLQSIADEVQLARLVEGALAALDVVPAGGDGVPDLASDVVGYVGQSMGTVLGGTYLAVEPSIEAAVLNVPGGGFVPLLQLSPSLSGIIEGFLPAGATASERLVLYSLGQMLVDDIDPANFASHVSLDPFPGRLAKDVLMQQAVDDEIVPAAATELLARALGMPQVEPELYPVFGLDRVAAPASGSGLYQFRTGAPEGLNHALLLTRPGALAQAAAYIDSRVRAGVARITRG